LLRARSISACLACATEKSRFALRAGSFAHNGGDGDSEEAGAEQKSGCAIRAPG
jgi:hypothetical protein